MTFTVTFLKFNITKSMLYKTAKLAAALYDGWLQPQIQDTCEEGLNMNRLGSKHSLAEQAITGGAAPRGRPDSTSELEELRESCPELTAALGIIVSAFVDLGFGTSATQEVERAANDNRHLKALAKEFQRSAA